MQDKMRLGIEILTGRFFYIEVGDEETVSGLKREIAKKEEFEESRLLLTHNNGCLMKEDQRSLVEYGCYEGCILYLNFLPIDGSPRPTPSEDCATIDFKES